MATKVKLIADGVITPDQITLTTASTGTNTTAPATTAFVQQEISALVDSSPDALNTLNELAAALGDDENFSTTVTDSIATKLPLAGGTLTGSLAITGTTLVSDDQTNDWVKQSVSGTTSTLTFGNTESTSGQAKWEYTRSDGRFKGYIGANSVNNFMSITSSGLIGIGTDSPDADLHISSATGVELHLQEETAGQAATLKLTNAQNSFVVGSDANPQIFFINTDGNQGAGLCIDTSHNVGIGTTSPDEKLHVHASDSGNSLAAFTNSTTVQLQNLLLV